MTSTIEFLNDRLLAGSNLQPCRPLRAVFLVTSMPVGGAETLLVNMIRQFDREKILPELCCLKEMGPLGEELENEIPVHSQFIAGKFDFRVFFRLRQLFRKRDIDAVITVGAGDKMFWGRLAARSAGVPVILSALHSTGWPDGVGRLNRLITPITDAIIAVARSHGKFLVNYENFPPAKVVVIPNGVDTDRFETVPDVAAIRTELGIKPTAPVVTIVAALRPEKNHEMFLRVAQRVVGRLPEARFLIVGDGPGLGDLQQLAKDIGIEHAVHFLGSRDDIPRILTATDVFALTSHNEANPVSILEAMSIGRPVVATNVGSVRESVDHGPTGVLVTPGNEAGFADALESLLQNPLQCQAMGAEARSRVVANWSLGAMVRGYESLVQEVYTSKLPRK